ncbi:hypothetical protein G6L12_08310 [Agrobacterium rhizogenes]|nr:hypothetical protein [Rhizobium rhizogenes]NTF74476.1 hypothetical protein [Rhizobium rhizogenes]
MITAVSIALYACSVFFAATVGVTAEQFRNDKADKTQGKFAVFFTVAPFLMASILQVFS